MDCLNRKTVAMKTAYLRPGSRHVAGDAPDSKMCFFLVVSFSKTREKSGYLTWCSQDLSMACKCSSSNSFSIWRLSSLFVTLLYEQLHTLPAREFGAQCLVTSRDTGRDFVTCSARRQIECLSWISCRSCVQAFLPNLLVAMNAKYVTRHALQFSFVARKQVGQKSASDFDYQNSVIFMPGLSSQASLVNSASHEHTASMLLGVQLSGRLSRGFICHLGWAIWPGLHLATHNIMFTRVTVLLNSTCLHRQPCTWWPTHESRSWHKIHQSTV